MSSVDSVKNKVSSFDNTLKLWENYKNKNNNKKLTISLVSDLTSIPYETTRRRIYKLAEKKWIYFSNEDGIVYNPESELNNIIVNKIHPYEKNLLKDFLVSFLMVDSKKK